MQIKKRPQPDAQEKIYNYGRNRKPIGSRRERQLPTACAGEWPAHTTGNNLHHKRIIQDSLSIFKSFLRFACV